MTVIGQRPFEQIREHYVVEKELATKLRSSNQSERTALYQTVYDELFQRVPHHPQLVEKQSPLQRNESIVKQVSLLKNLVTPDATFLEVGAGYCALSIRIAADVLQVFAVEVSVEVTKDLDRPENFQLVISNGTEIPVTPSSIDVAYSNQLMEHLHPDDAIQQLRNIFAALENGGRYLCITPNGLAGPHDISRHFDQKATGFHLKEYSYQELTVLFRQVGFQKIGAYIGGNGSYIRIPILPILLFERLWQVIPYKLRRTITKMSPFIILQNVRLVGKKLA